VPPLATGKVPVTLVARFAKVVEVVPVPPLAIGSVPVTPVVKGNPVVFVRTPDAGVPRAGVTKVGLVIVGVVKVGLVPKTFAPEPVEVVTPVPPEVAANGFVKETTWALVIDIAVVPLVWIAIAPVVSVVIFNDVAAVVPALSVVAILSS
jgi:hypothetical protein